VHVMQLAILHAAAPGIVQSCLARLTKV
jgi:hypothetical protein